jgi:hypothetical protein
MASEECEYGCLIVHHNSYRPLHWYEPANGRRGNDLCFGGRLGIPAALTRLRVLKEAANPESGNAATFSGPHSGLTAFEELTATRSIEVRQRQYDCLSPTEGRHYAGRLLL